MERRCPDTLLAHTDSNGGFLALVRFLNTYYGKKELSQCWTAFKIPASNTPTRCPSQHHLVSPIIKVGRTNDKSGFEPDRL